MRIIRVFPRRTNLTPLDDMAFSRKTEKGVPVGDGDLPGMFLPEHDAVHICAVFTWDKDRAEFARDAWRDKTNKPVLIDGPAYGNSGGDFVPGRYVKPGVVFLSRGCPNACSFCFVPKRERGLRELPIVPGNIINDNNFLACSREHRRKAYDMLRTQKQIRFQGGLEAQRLTDWDIEELRSLRIFSMHFACDSDGQIGLIQKTGERLTAAGFHRNQLACYCLSGDDMDKNEARCRAVYNAGFYPFAQLYQPETPIEYSEEWKKWVRVWSRPLATRRHMKEVSP